MLLAAAPFTPAILISFVMLLLAGFIGYKGYLQTSMILLLINTLAILGSPGTDISNMSVLIFIPIIFTLSFTGVMLGIRKAIGKKSHNA